MTDTIRQRVHCTECPWTTQRDVEGVSYGECAVCGAPMEGPRQPGRTPKDPSEKRVRVVAFVLPATLKWLQAPHGPNAAAQLDELAARAARLAASKKRAGKARSKKRPKKR